MVHPLAARFVEVTDSYERGRPEYSEAVVRVIAAELKIPAGASVLDLAAGTGKLTRALLGVGLDVIAVEPQAELREVLTAGVGGERVREGLAEAIPLTDASVAAVTVGEGFHWFDQVLALNEIRRVLRPGGGLAVLSTVPDWGAASWAHEVGTLLAELRPRHPQFDGPGWQDAVLKAGCWTAPRELRLTTTQPASTEQILDYLASISWVADLPAERRAETLAKIGGILSTGETPAEMPAHVVIGLTSLA